MKSEGAVMASRGAAPCEGESGRLVTVVIRLQTKIGHCDAPQCCGAVATGEKESTRDADRSSTALSSPVTPRVAGSKRGLNGVEMEQLAKE